MLMADMNDMFSQILSNPQAMQQIMSMVQSMGLQGNGQAPSAPPPPPQQPQYAPQPPQQQQYAPPPPQQQQRFQQPQGDPSQLLRNLMNMSQQQPLHGEDRQLALFQALKPFVGPDRAAKLDKALQVARISRMASTAFSQMDTKNFSGR